MPKTRQAQYGPYVFTYSQGEGPMKRQDGMLVWRGELRWEAASTAAHLVRIASDLARGTFYREEGDERPFYELAAGSILEIADALAEAAGGVKREPDQP